MTNYYIEKDNKIVLYDNDANRLELSIAFMPQYIDLEIKETERPLVLSDDCSEFIWADTAEYLSEELAKAKELKTQEATDKAYSFEEKDALITVSATNLKTRASGTYHIEGNLTNNIKMSAYASTLDDTSVVPWNTKENVNILLNKTACDTLTSIMSQLNAKLWTVDFPSYLAQIEACETKEDVEAIEIEYQNPAEIVDVNIPPEEGETADENTTGIELPEVQENSDISQDNSGEIEE